MVLIDTNISTLLYRYPTSILYGQLNLLDSHDVSRFFTVCNQNIDKMELAVLFQMTFPGMPCVFYGDEKGIIGEEEFEYRSPMPWRNEHVLEEIYQKLIFLRKSKPALQHGDFTTIIAAGYEYAYCRTWKDQKITVVMNLGTDDVQSTGRAGTLILKKGENHGIIKQFEYEVREDIIDVSDNL
ncbi:MAG: DUF3459 domain-containing protein [Lachnospiraceae bacterium]|nr:DUF3459 domain-containing protein [Lachnospiraceae bacterium]